MFVNFVSSILNSKKKKTFFFSFFFGDSLVLILLQISVIFLLKNQRQNPNFKPMVKIYYERNGLKIKK